MGSRRKTGDSARLPAISRRVAMGAAGASLLGLIDPDHAAWSSPIAARCATWLSLDARIDRLARRWAELEATAGDAGGPGSHSVRLEMTAVETELAELDDACERALADLAVLTPLSVHDVTGQLAVAARLVRHEGGDASRLVERAHAFLTAGCCPGCGAAYAPAGLARTGR